MATRRPDRGGNPIADAAANFTREIFLGVVRDEIQSFFRNRPLDQDGIAEVLRSIGRLPGVRHRVVSQSAAAALQRAITSSDDIDPTTARAMGQAVNIFVSAAGAGLADNANREVPEEDWNRMANEAAAAAMALLPFTNPDGTPGLALGVIFEGIDGFHEIATDDDGQPLWMAADAFSGGFIYPQVRCRRALEHIQDYHRNNERHRTDNNNGRQVIIPPARACAFEIVSLDEALRRLGNEAVECTICRYVRRAEEVREAARQAGRQWFEQLSAEAQELIQTVISTAADHGGMAPSVLADYMTTQEMGLVPAIALHNFALEVAPRTQEVRAPGEGVGQGVRVLRRRDYERFLITLQVVGDSTLELRTQLMRFADGAWVRVREGWRDRPNWFGEGFLGWAWGFLLILGLSVGLPLLWLLIWVILILIMHAGWFYYAAQPDETPIQSGWEIFKPRFIVAAVTAFSSFLAWVISQPASILGGGLLGALRRLSTSSTALDRFQVFMHQVTGYKLVMGLSLISMMHLTMGSDFISLFIRFTLWITAWLTVGRDAQYDKAALEPDDPIDLRDEHGNLTREWFRGAKARHSISGAQSTNMIKRIYYSLMIVGWISRAFFLMIWPSYLMWACQFPVEIYATTVERLDRDSKLDGKIELINQDFERRLETAREIKDIDTQRKAIKKLRREHKDALQRARRTTANTQEMTYLIATPDGRVILAEDTISASLKAKSGRTELETIVQSFGGTAILTHTDLDFAGYWHRCRPYRADIPRIEARIEAAHGIQDPNERQHRLDQLQDRLSYALARKDRMRCWIGQSNSLLWEELSVFFGAQPYESLEDPALRKRLDQRRDPHANSIDREIEEWLYGKPEKTTLDWSEPSPQPSVVPTTPANAPKAAPTPPSATPKRNPLQRQRPAGKQHGDKDRDLVCSDEAVSYRTKRLSGCFD